MFLTESSVSQTKNFSIHSLLEDLIDFNTDFESQKYDIIKLEHEIALEEQELLLTEAMDMNALGASAKDNTKVAEVAEKKKTFGDKAKGIWETIKKFIIAIGQKIAAAFRTVWSKITEYFQKAKNFVKQEAQIEDPAPLISSLEDAIAVTENLGHAETKEQIEKFKAKINELKTVAGPRKAVTVKKEQAIAYAKKIEELGKKLESSTASALKAAEAKASSAQGDASAVKEAASLIVSASHKGLSYTVSGVSSIMSKFK
jgi:hypothetical protein